MKRIISLILLVVIGANLFACDAETLDTVTKKAMESIAENEIIQGDAAKIRAQDTEYHSLLVIAEGRAQGHQDAGGGHRLAQLHSQELVHQLRHDVQTAGGGIGGEQLAQTHADHQDVADDVDQRIPGQGLKIREQPLKDADGSRQQHGTVDGFHTKLRTDQKKADGQKAHVHDHGDQRCRQGDKLTDDQRQTGGTAHRHMAGVHKEVDSSSDNDGADGDVEKFPEIAFVEHGDTSLPGLYSIRYSSFFFAKKQAPTADFAAVGGRVILQAPSRVQAHWARAQWEQVPWAQAQ